MRYTWLNATRDEEGLRLPFLFISLKRFIPILNQVISWSIDVLETFSDLEFQDSTRYQ